jgi:hypothetical protein
VKQLLADVPAGTVISQKRFREDIDIGCGVLTIQTNKRRRLRKDVVSSEGSHAQQAQRDVVASFLFRPKNGKSTLTISVTQGQLLDRSMMSIPRLFVNRIIPNNSPVFRVVQEGRIEELRMMLTDNRASLRDYDERGLGLLHVSLQHMSMLIFQFRLTHIICSQYAAEWPDICRLLLEAGVDVDCGKQSALVSASVRRFHQTTALLLQYGADPTLGLLPALNFSACQADDVRPPDR